MSHPTESLHLNKISATEFTQSRAKINSEVVAEYVEAMQAGDKFPAVIVYEDAGVYHLADGFHRYQAATDAGFTDILAEIHVGNRKDAIRHAVGANAVHGAQRTNADKRKAVSMALDAFPRMVSTDIARLCAVSHFLVDTIRKASAFNADEPQVREKTDGTTYTIKPKAPAPTPAPVTAPIPTALPTPMPEAKAVEVVDPIQVNESITAIMYAKSAIEQLRKIPRRDKRRKEAFQMVRDYMDAEQTKGGAK